MMEGSESRAIHVVRSGQIRLFKTAFDGRELGIEYLGPGAVVGIETLGRRDASCTAEVTREADLCAFPSSALRGAIHDDVTIATCYVTNILADLARAHQLVMDLGVRTARERVAAFLLRQALDGRRSVGTDNALPCRFVLQLSRRQIADHLGLASETVIRILMDMHRDGIVEVSGRTVAMRDLTELRRIAN
ncbi:MAG TPA: Crp/Fnr family transcriptional regulator [Spirochaetia bacterium]|nr:Crp/Fnr family transcriptional regulator [Spirochaetia bacterium]